MVSVVVGVLLGGGATPPAGADAKLERKYAGLIVISPDPAPTVASELPSYVQANLVKDGPYELIKGSPWQVHLVGFLSKPAGKRPLMLVLADAADPKLVAIDTLEVGAKGRLVITSTKLTTAAGYVVNKTYAVRLMRDQTVLARTELKLRD